MSEPFTNPADASWQDLLDEITLAYSERRQVLGQSEYVATDDKDVQAASYWTTLQGWLESNYTFFIDHINGPLDPTGTFFLFFTLATWRDTAGLNASGFTRKYGPKESLITDYGQMQEGDAIGPWIFDELQKGFGALKQARVAFSQYLNTGEPAACGYSEKPFYPYYSPDIFQPKGSFELSLTIYDNLPFAVALSTGYDYSFNADDFLTVNGVRYDAKDLCVWYDDWGCPGGYVGSRSYKGGIDLGSFEKGESVSFNIIDNMRGLVGGSGYLLADYDFTNA
jgi:hypothetical protein